MTTIPQELINAVIHEVEDTKSLKAYSLAVSNFLEPSQRILLRFLTLDLASSTLLDLLGRLLAESPHIAAYFTILSLHLTVADILTHQVLSLRDLLAKLTNVQQCTIAGTTIDACRWADLAPVTPAFLDLIQRQQLAELHVLFFAGIPLPVLGLFMRSARKLSLFDVDVDIDGESLPEIQPTDSGMAELFVSQQSPSFYYAVTCPQFASYTANLRKLDVALSTTEYIQDLMRSTAHTLETIRFDCTAPDHDPALPPLPALPALRSIDLVMPIGEHNEPRLLDVLSTILASRPATLTEIRLLYEIYLPLDSPYLLQPETLVGLSRLFADPTTPRLRARLDIHADEDGEMLAGFRTSLQQGLHGFCAEGKLFVEGYSFKDAEFIELSRR
ncbi:hypothetical protein B0H17DRAFT_1077603 [Mycena rosella]|uniref:Uncharacterized protein n=1 Tax=Mycena rosella TaxID=1033263 RepID=A0AAD7D550_MYCRO|nr:hypothetical protein B0H17DRAFT_1077603 [Mycena rosella]